MRIKERVSAIVTNMNRIDLKGNLFTLVFVQEPERFVRRHGVGPFWNERDSHNCFIYPFRINFEQILLYAENQDALNKDCNDHFERDINESITVICRSSYKKNEHYFY